MRITRQATVLCVPVHIRHMSVCKYYKYRLGCYYNRPDSRKRYSAAEEASEVSRRVIEASKRPTSMAVPLPSWSANGEGTGGVTASSKSIAVSGHSTRSGHRTVI